LLQRVASVVWLGIAFGAYPFMFIEVLMLSHILPTSMSVMLSLLATAGACAALYLGITGVIEFRDSFHRLSEVKVSEHNIKQTMASA
jgi:hypothetical protein